MKKKIKQVFRIIVQFVLLLWDKVYPTKGIPVLLYHETRENGAENGAIPNIDPKTFEWQMKYLHSHGYQTLNTSQLLGELKVGTLPRKAVVITFDDGFKSNLEAFRIMEKYGYEGLCFVATSFLGKEYDFMPYYLSHPSMDYATSDAKDQKFEFMSIEDLKACNNIEMYPHTHHHIDMTSFSTDDIKRELYNSEKILRTVNDGNIAFSYPRGLFNESIKSILKGRGYKLSFAVLPGTIKMDSDLFMLPRTNVPTEKILFKLILTDKYQYYSRLSCRVNG